MQTSKTLTLRNESEYKCIDLTDLLYVSVNDYLSSFHSMNNQKFMCTKSLLEVESVLPDNFFRINRNCIVNLYNIDSIHPGNRTILLSNSVEFIVSHRRIKQLKITLTRCNRTITGWLDTLTSCYHSDVDFKYSFHNIVLLITLNELQNKTITDNLIVIRRSLNTIT